MNNKTKSLGFLTKNKKGSIILDTITAVVVLSAFAFITIIGYFFIDDVYQASIDTMNESTNTSYQIMERTHNEYPPIYDGIFVFLVFGLWITSIVSTFFLDTQPLFFVVSLLLLSSILLIAMVMSNAYFDLASDSGFTDIVSNFPMTNFFMDKLPYVALIIYFTIGVFMFAKSSV